METKQTAVEWLYQRLQTEPYLTLKDFEQAKAMEKQQIIDAYNNGDLRSAELYYGETYGNSKTPPGAHCEEA